jgi:peptidoglycan/xylan/chitin deacetylase (PgdA/CDA1 family)
MRRKMDNIAKLKVRTWVLLVLIILTRQAGGQNRKVSFSFDDLPYVSYSVTDTVLLKGLFNNLVHSLKEYRIPAIGFVNELKLFEEGKPAGYRTRLLNSWASNGLDFGNHTFSHKDYNSAPLSEFSQDILKGGLITADILQKSNRQLKYFRHPYLHTGNSGQS